MVDALARRYGALGQGGVPRLLQGMMTTELENGVPVDHVVSYNWGVEELHAWVAYDNLDGDTLKAELVSSVGTTLDVQEVRVKGTFGRAIFTFQRGEVAWSAGTYQVILTAEDAEEVVEFIINNFDTHASRLVITDGQLALPGDELVPGAASGNWQVADVAQPEDGFSQLIRGSDRVLAVNYRGSIASSGDGEQWTLHEPGFNVAPTRFGWANGRFFGFTSSRTHQYTSGDGSSWTQFEMGTHDPLVSIMYTHDGYVGRSERNHALQSDDGHNWQRYGYAVEGHHSLQNIYLDDVGLFTYHDGLYWWIRDGAIESGSKMEDMTVHTSEGLGSVSGGQVLFGSSKTLLYTQYRLYHWEGNRITEIDSDNTGGGFIKIFEHGDGYLAVRSNGNIYRSGDAVNWDRFDDGPGGLESVTDAAFIGNRLVLIFGGRIYSMAL